MRLYLDENIPVTLAVILETHGTSCLTTRDAGNLGLPDRDQLRFATQEHRTLVTFNAKDFMVLNAQWQSEGLAPHGGIVLSREVPFPELVRRFLAFLTTQRNQDLTNKVLWLPARPRLASR